MAKAAPALVNFNSGEFSPLLSARIDLAQYGNAESVLENFIPTVQGALQKRAGTKFVGQTKNNTRCVLMPFEYSTTQSYVVELGEKYAWFYTSDASTGKRGLLVQPDGQPVEVETPYALSDLMTPEGIVNIRYAQAADIVYICCAGYPVQVLKRTSATSFVMEEFVAINGAFQDVNDNEALRVYASGQTGAVTIAATGDIFREDMVGELFYIEKSPYIAAVPWGASEKGAIGDFVVSDNKYYKCVGVAGTNNDGKGPYAGNIKPTHTKGLQWDYRPGWYGYQNPEGFMGLLWEYQDSGYGHIRITEYISPTQVRGEVLSRLPVFVVGSGQSTYLWAYGAWGKKEGYPTSVAFFKGRLWFARGSKVWGSVAANYTDFAAKDASEITDDMAISVELSSGKINAIQWLMPAHDLIAGTSGAEFSIGEMTNGNPLSPKNVRSILQSELGTKDIQPVKNGASLLFIQRAGLKAQEFYYSYEGDGYTSQDATILAEHITYGTGFFGEYEPIYGIASMVLTQEPTPIVWMLRTDKKLVGFTWNNEQQVKGWHRHLTDGDVESITSILAIEGDRNELWACIKRNIDGQDRYYIEYMDGIYNSAQPQADQYFVDCGLTYRGDPIQTVSGLEHLEGKSVDVLADGAINQDVVVKNGEITLSQAASVIHVGLPYTATYKSLRLEAGASNGTSQGKIKRINKVVYRFHATGVVYGGYDENNLDPVLFRTSYDAMGAAVPLFSGNYEFVPPNRYDMDGYIMLQSKDPLNCVIVGIFPTVVTQEG